MQRPPDLGKRLRPVLIMAGSMWVLAALNALPGIDLMGLGIRPRSFESLPWILTAPFLHAGFGHLIGNTVPFLALGSLVALGRKEDLLESTLTIVLGGGFLVWLLGSDGIHLGSSLLVFGWFGFAVARGVVARRPRELLMALIALVLFFFPIVVGLVPAPFRSFAAHLFGLAMGALSGWACYRSPRT